MDVFVLFAPLCSRGFWGEGGSVCVCVCMDWRGNLEGSDLAYIMFLLFGLLASWSRKGGG